MASMAPKAIVFDLDGTIWDSWPKCRNSSGPQLYPAVRETLQKLSERRVPLGVVTNLPSWMADSMLAVSGIRDTFGSVIDYGQTTRHKPHPDPLILVLKRLRITPSRDVWYVGDLESDARAAFGAGVSFGWASYGYGTKPEKTSGVFSEFDEILSL
jgi:HAD superfamily hydrolase (TIGR01662 family)